MEQIIPQQSRQNKFYFLPTGNSITKLNNSQQMLCIFNTQIYIKQIIQPDKISNVKYTVLLRGQITLLKFTRFKVVQFTYCDHLGLYKTDTQLESRPRHRLRSSVNFLRPSKQMSTQYFAQATSAFQALSQNCGK